MNSAVAGTASKYGSAPLEFIAPRTASRWAVALPAAAGYRPCSAVSQDGVGSVAGPQRRQLLFTAHECGITPRSSGAPTACHQRPAGGTRYIFATRALASCRRRPLSSNVRHPRNAFSPLHHHEYNKHARRLDYWSLLSRLRWHEGWRGGRSATRRKNQSAFQLPRVLGRKVAGWRAIPGQRYSCSSSIKSAKWCGGHSVRRSCRRRTEFAGRIKQPCRFVRLCCHAARREVSSTHFRNSTRLRNAC